MKRLILFWLLVVGFIQFAHTQNIEGIWNGLLKIQGSELRLVFNIHKTDTGYWATMDSPDQGAKGLKMSPPIFEDSVLSLEAPALYIKYKGRLSADGNIKGEFKQSGFSIPLVLSRAAQVKAPLLRPQEPRKPYSYYTEDLVFENKEAVLHLAATLSLPRKEGRFPAVILISGSGPQNRDEELLGHKPFLILADYLTQNGIAVLRYDDRGTGQSTGNFKGACTPDFASDVRAAIQYLKSRKEIDSTHIGLIGHSEGGIIAPMVAVDTKDVAFIVLLAGTGIAGDQILLLQQEYIARADGANESIIEETRKNNKELFTIIKNTEDTAKLKEEVKTYINELFAQMPQEELAGQDVEKFLHAQLKRVMDPWMLYFLKYDPSTALEKVQCPVLALNGSKDLQVPAKENLAAIQKALEKAGNKNISIQELPNLNHLFQECESGSPREYAKIEQTFSPDALKIIGDWIQIQVKK